LRETNIAARILQPGWRCCKPKTRTKCASGGYGSGRCFLRAHEKDISPSRALTEAILRAPVPMQFFSLPFTESAIKEEWAHYAQSPQLRPRGCPEGRPNYLGWAIAGADDEVGEWLVLRLPPTGLRHSPRDLYYDNEPDRHPLLLALKKHTVMRRTIDALLSRASELDVPGIFVEEEGRSLAALVKEEPSSQWLLRFPEELAAELSLKIGQFSIANYHDLARNLANEVFSAITIGNSPLVVREVASVILAYADLPAPPPVSVQTPSAAK
jgi:hypothetical protein